MTLPRLCWLSTIIVVVAAVSDVAVSIIVEIGVASRNHVDFLAIVVDTRYPLAAAIAPAAEVIFFIQMCSVDGIFAICLAVGDVHLVIKGFGLDAPELLLKFATLDAVLEGVDSLSSEMFAVEFFMIDQRSMYERMDSLVRWVQAHNSSIEAGLLLVPLKLRMKLYPSSS